VNAPMCSANRQWEYADPSFDSLTAYALWFLRGSINQIVVRECSDPGWSCTRVPGPSESKSELAVQQTEQMMIDDQDHHTHSSLMRLYCDVLTPCVQSKKGKQGGP